MTHPVPPRIVVVGGGTAGWIAACLLAKAWGPRGAAVTLVESEEIGIIGVGEGSTPQLKAFFDALGIAEVEWMGPCDATYKGGILFEGWADAPGPQRYFHPFQTAFDAQTAPAFFRNSRLRRAGIDVPAHPDRFFALSRLALDGRAPVPGGDAPEGAAYGYHFDAVGVGRFLGQVGRSLGVAHRIATVRDVETGDDGRRVAAVVLDDGTRLKADLFVDCTGFRALLAEGALGARHLSFADNLFCDRAVVTPTPHVAAPVAYTKATALSAGWAWAIPLTSRVGNGYVYASRYLDDEAAADELRAHLGLAPDAPVRHLRMRVGRLAESWTGNVLAVGLAQGFIEPLEATAIHLALATVDGFIAAHDGQGEAGRGGFNAEIARRYEGVRDYIVAHYRLQQRRDTPFWRDNAGNGALSEPLKALMTAWFTADDLSAAVRALGVGDIYAPLSWHCLMGGYGVYPPRPKLRAPAAGQGADMAAIDRFVADIADRYPMHETALARTQGVKA